MPKIVFITNRNVTGDPADARSYTGDMGPATISGIAEVSEVRPELLASGRITRIGPVRKGALEPAAAQRIAAARHVIVFVHGFANAFEEAITRAAFNLQWFGLEGPPASDALMVTFTWPSPGKTLGFGKLPESLKADPSAWSLAAALGMSLPGDTAYLADQARARASGAALLTALDWVRGALGGPRPGRRVILMAHSMGNEALASALAQPQAPQTRIFDEVFLLAADAAAVRGPTVPPWLLTARAIGGRVHIYHSSEDSPLKLSHIVNREERLGFLGRSGWQLATTPGIRCVDCTPTWQADQQGEEGPPGHWYYRRVPAVRRDIAEAMRGGGRDGASIMPAPVQAKSVETPGSSA